MTKQTQKPDVFVLIDCIKGVIHPINQALLQEARSLADMTGGECQALLLGKGLQEIAETLTTVDRVLYFESNALEHFIPDSYAAPIIAFLAPKPSWTLIIGATSSGMDLAAKIALKTKAGLLLNCRKLSFKGDQFQAEISLHSGKIKADVSCSSPCLVSVMYPAPSRSPVTTRNHAPTVKKVVLPAGLQSNVTMKSYIQSNFSEEIANKRLIMGVGKDIETRELLNRIHKCFKKLGAHIVASKDIIHLGWIPSSRQVGRLGMRIAPKYYVALGISGAPEHLDAVDPETIIIGVNSDPQAPIFSRTSLGVLAELEEFVDVLETKIGG